MSHEQTNQAFFVLLVIVVLTIVQGAIVLGLRCFHSNNEHSVEGRPNQGRGTLALMTVIFVFLVVIVIAHSSFILALNASPVTNVTDPPTFAPKQDGSETVWQKSKEQIIGGIFTLVGAAIGALVSFLTFKWGLQTNTRIAFLSMILSSSTTQNEINLFITYVNEGKFEQIKGLYEKPAIILLSVLKPKVWTKFKDAVKDSNHVKTKKLRDELLRA